MYNFLVLSIYFACLTFSYKLIKILIQRLKLGFKQYRMTKKVPGPPAKGFILGNIKEIFTSSEEAPKQIENLFNRYGRVIALWFPFSPFIIIGRADYAEYFFTAKNTTKSEFLNYMRVVMGQGLLLNDGQVWKERRKLIDPAFHSTILAGFCEVFVNNSIQLVQKLRALPPNTSVDIKKINHLITLHNICETAMGVKIDALNNLAEEYTKAFQIGDESFYTRSLRPWYWSDFIFYFIFPYGRKVKKSADTINDFIENVIKVKRRERAQARTTGAGELTNGKHSSGKKRRAFLDLVMDAAETQSVPLSDEDLMNEVKNLIGAGYGASGLALDFMTYLLGLHPDIQEKCCSELERIFNGSDRRPTTTDLQDMKYLEQVINETLRLFPGVPIISRKLMRDTKIGEYYIAEGTLMNLDIFHMHRDPMYFPDPEKFDPDRFSPENSANRHPYAFVPFGAGSRNCIGQKFLMMQMKIIMTYILRNFTLESLDSHKPLPIQFAVTLQSSRKLEIIFRPKKDSHII